MATTFKELGLPPELLDAVQARGYTTPTRVQADAIGPLLAGHDVVVQAPTGTGKTAAFCLPLLMKVDAGRRQVQALVLTPTRELAIQVGDMLDAYSAKTDGLKVVRVYGGQPFDVQLRALHAGAQVVVGTPGRVMEHLRRQTISLDFCTYAVIDEADEMLRMGFLEDVEWILARAPKEQRQTALFSATIPVAVRRVARNNFKTPRTIGTENKLTVDTIEELAIEVPEGMKVEALMRVLDGETIQAALIFARTQQSVADLAGTLERNGFRVEGFHGGMSQGHRERVVTRLRAGLIDVVIATDVAARGLDFQRLSHVVVFDAPRDPELWVHRAGRTGRSGRQGKAILLFSPRDYKRVKGIELYTHRRLPRGRLMDDAEAATAREGRLKRRIRAVLTDEAGDAELKRYKRVLSEVVEEGGVDPITVAAALARLLHGERPLGAEQQSRITVKPRPGKGGKGGKGAAKAGGRGGKTFGASSDRPPRNPARPKGKKGKPTVLNPDSPMKRRGKPRGNDGT